MKVIGFDKHNCRCLCIGYILRGTKKEEMLLKTGLEKRLISSPETIDSPRLNEFTFSEKNPNSRRGIFYFKKSIPFKLEDTILEGDLKVIGFKLGRGFDQLILEDSKKNKFTNSNPLDLIQTRNKVYFDDLKLNLVPFTPLKI